MITIDIVTLAFIVCMLLCIIIVPLGEGHSEAEYMELKRKYEQQREAYLKLIDVFEKVETDEL